jgi:hypothetical protein
VLKNPFKDLKLLAMRLDMADLKKKWQVQKSKIPSFFSSLPSSTISGCSGVTRLPTSKTRSLSWKRSRKTMVKR